MPNPRTLQDYLDARPVPAVAHEVAPDGHVVLLRPKFLVPWMHWLQRRLRRPHFRVHLDRFGTNLWLHLDGQRSVAELAQIQRQTFGPEAEPSEERTARFTEKLIAGRFARWAP